MSKKKPAKKAARAERKAVVKPPKVPPRQPKLKNRKTPKPRMNGPVPEPAALELGARLMPSAELAAEVLEEVATMNDAALQLEADYKAKAESAKDAKKAWHDKVAEVQRYIRLNTHESSLPLLSEAEREADAEKMEAAIAAGGEL
jgi:hypothetical protein